MTTASTDADAGAAPLRSRPVRFAWTSLLLSGALLVGIIVFADARQVFAHLKRIDTRWLAVAFLVSLLHLVVLGSRYAHIARSLGLPLPWLRATTEYALSVLVNQLFPTGLVGDGLRAVRQAKHAPESHLAPAVEAVVLDRVSGHAVVWLVVFGTVPFGFGVAVLDFGRLATSLAVVGLAAAVVALLVVKVKRLERVRRSVRYFVTRGLRVLLVPKHALVHVPLSLAHIGLMLLQLYVSARAVGTELSPRQLLWVGPLIVLAMSVPSFFSGWGIREGASAMLFTAIGLPGSTGVAVALTFGVFSLIVALPAAVVLLFDSARAVPTSTRWGQAHALGMATGLGLALWTQFPPLAALVACLSFAIVIVQLRADWTPNGSFGLANSITGFRLLLATLILLGYRAWPGAWLAGIAVLVLALDALDGWWARRHDTSSEFGALFDIEVDTILVVALSLTLLVRGQSDTWVLLPPLLRYGYVLLPVLVTPLRAAASRTRFARFAYVFMIATFVVGLVVPPALSAPLTLAGTLLVTLSFLGSFWQSYAPDRVYGAS